MIRRVIDLHAHILPGLDDGPPTLDASAEMAAAAVATGTRVLAATSHVNRGFGLTAADLDEARAAVRERLAADGIPLDVVQGGEVSMSRVPEMEEDELRGFTLGGGPWLLLECPLSPRAPSMEPMVAALRRSGFQILLAHPERSPGHMRDPGPLQRLIHLGAIAQVTSSSFAGRFGDTVRRAAFEMLERDQVHVLASDGHSPVHRPPDLLCALEAFEGRYDDPQELFDWMTEGVPRALLDGAPIPARPELPARRGGLLRRFRA